MIVLDLCGGTGSWSAPYREAGYQIELVDLPRDVRLLEKPEGQIHGILAAPPCTFFSRMRMCRGRPTDDQFKEALSIVDACLRLVVCCRPKWWALENPQGYLAKWLGSPAMKFDPWEFGDPWTKRTWIWGDFTPPMSSGSIVPKGRLVGSRKGNKAIAQTFEERARTPSGFAKAFFEANP